MARNPKRVYHSESGCNLPQIDLERAHYRFGVFELERSSGELRKLGVKLKLQEQPLQLLLLLLERHGQIVTREDIQRRLWPEKTFVDFDNAINSAVRKLRDALSDSAENPRFIETLARRGYRFVAPVNAPAEPVPVPEIRRPKWRFGITRPAGAAIAGACVASLIGAGILWEHDRQATRRIGDDALPPPVLLTSYPGFQKEPSFSPDGGRVAFSWEEPGKGQSKIYVKLIGSSSEPLRLSTGEGEDFAPAWSPDGRSIAFLRSLGPFTAAVVLIPSLGGPERELVRLQLRDDQERRPWKMPSPQLAWSPDGKWLLATEQIGPEMLVHFGVVRISVESGEKTRIELLPEASSKRNQANLPLNSGESGFALSPDGRNLAFVQIVESPRDRLFVVPLSPDMMPAGSPRLVHFDESFIPGIAWDAEGRYLVVPSDRRGRAEMWRVPVEVRGQPVRLNLGDDHPGEVAVSKTAQRLVFTHYSIDEDIWRLDLNSPHLQNASSFIASTASEAKPSYSSSGKRIAFESERSGAEEIWTSNADGSQPVQLTSFGKAWSGTPRWSPDDRQIAFDSNISGRWNIYAIGSGGGKPVRLTQGEGESIRPSWSHDGKWIYYCSVRTSGPQILKIPASGGAEVQVTKNGGSNQMESPDGTYLYYLSGNMRGLWRVPTAGGNDVQILAPIDELTFAMGRRGVYVASSYGVGATPLRLVDFETGAVTSVGTLPVPAIGGLAVSPDEHWLLFVKSELSGSQLMLIENFR